MQFGKFPKDCHSEARFIAASRFLADKAGFGMTRSGMVPAQTAPRPAVLDFAPCGDAQGSNAKYRCIVGEHIRVILRILRSQASNGPFSFRRRRNQHGFSAYEHVPETCPVFVVLVNEQCHLRRLFDVLQPRQLTRSHPLWLVIYSGIENRSVTDEADGNSVWLSVGVQRSQPCDPRGFQFRSN